MISYQYILDTVYYYSSCFNTFISIQFLGFSCGLWFNCPNIKFEII